MTWCRACAARMSRDNDELTLRERDGSDWWMHVAGFPGSHVVIRKTDAGIWRRTCPPHAGHGRRRMQPDVLLPAPPTSGSGLACAAC